MIPSLAALLAQIGLPILGRVLSRALRALDHPAADAAADALTAVEAITSSDGMSAKRQEAVRHAIAEAVAAEAERDSTVARVVNATFQAEIASTDRFVRRWRPTFGYAVAATWTVQMTGLTGLILFQPSHAADIVGALAELTTMWAVALSVLGLSVANRSRDKALALGVTPNGPIERMLDTVRERLIRRSPQPSESPTELWRNPDTGTWVRSP